MKRRDFMIALSAVAAFPAAARAQQAAVPLIGFLSARSPEEAAGHTAAVLQGLKEFGYVDGQTATIEYRWSRGRYDMLPALARELVALRPALIVAGGGLQSARAAKSATTSIPIVFIAGGDPVDAGLV